MRVVADDSHDAAGNDANGGETADLPHPTTYLDDPHAVTGACLCKPHRPAPLVCMGPMEADSPMETAHRTGRRSGERRPLGPAVMTQ